MAAVALGSSFSGLAGHRQITFYTIIILKFSKIFLSLRFSLFFELHNIYNVVSKINGLNYKKGKMKCKMFASSVMKSSDRRRIRLRSRIEGIAGSGSALRPISIPNIGNKSEHEARLQIFWHPDILMRQFLI